MKYKLLTLTVRSIAGGVRSGVETSSRGSGGNASGWRTQALGDNGYRQVSAAQGMRRGSSGRGTSALAETTVQSAAYVQISRDPGP